MEPADTLFLDVTNFALGVLCVLLAGVVVGGVVWEWVARRRERASLPDRWPPDDATGRGPRDARGTTRSPGGGAP